MLTIRQITDNKDEIIRRLSKRNADFTSAIDAVIRLDEQRRACQNTMNQAQSEINSISKQIGTMFQQGNNTGAGELKIKTGTLKEEIQKLENELAVIEIKIKDILVTIPNAPHDSVPAGKSSEDNVEVESGGVMPVLDAGAMAHWDLAKKYNIIDFDLGNKITGAGFPCYIGKGAKLQRALISFFLDEAEKAGYTEILPPFMVNEESGFGTGQLPDKEGQMYHVTLDNLFLVPTAEVPVTNLYRDVILDSSEMPVKNTAYTPCFRREAGSYGKLVRGLNRVHQFDKVEIVQIQHPDNSYEALKEMVAHSVGLLKKLQLPYRVVHLCGGDMGFASACTYDLEVFAAAQKIWLEVSSVSNFESFQSNRLKLRFKDKGDKKTQLAHTLNGSALALPRIVACILENNQKPGGIVIPEVLRKYTGFDIIS